jgi:hypothetical protein
MRQIEYNNSAFAVRLEYPLEWDVQNISSVTLGIKDLSGTALLAATATTPWTAIGIRLSGAVETYDNTITLEPSGAGSVPDLAPGDRIQIVASAAGPSESVEVLHYSSVTKIATLKRDLIYDHSDETAVVGLFVTYDLDTSDTDTFIAGKQMVFTWTPNTDDIPIKERAEIAKAEYAPQGFSERFLALYPRRHQVLTSPEYRLGAFLDEAKQQLRAELMVRNLDLNRVVDTRLLDPALMAKIAWLSLLGGDDEYTVERETIMGEYQKQFELLCTAPIWQDTDQDEVEESNELEDHQQLFYERGL